MFEKIKNFVQEALQDKPSREERIKQLSEELSKAYEWRNQLGERMRRKRGVGDRGYGTARAAGNADARIQHLRDELSRLEKEKED